MQDKKRVVYRFGELFCGPGGLAWGAHHASIETDKEVHNIEHAWASDYDEDACKTYRENLCPDSNDSVICKDVRHLSLSELSPIDCFAYGFPCNDFSIVGEQKGFAGEYGPLYVYGVEVLNRFKPKFFVAENVSGLVSANNGKAFKQIIEDLRTAGNGYNITAHLYKAEEYGVAQCRHRIIVVGIDRTLGKFFRVPAPTTKDKPLTAQAAIEDPPIPPDAPNNERTRQSKQVIRRLRHIKPGENAWTANIPEELQLNVSKARLSHIYRRLEPDKPSYTITGSGGGGTHVYHWEEPRALTNRERARLQSFEDSFVFFGRKESVRRQIGMAVPPLLAQQIFKATLRTLASVEYECVDANIGVYAGGEGSG